MVKKVSLVVAVLMVGFIALVATRSSTYAIERSVSVDAPAEVAFDYLSDLHNWPVWSPWEKLDPAVSRTFEGAEAGEGAIYRWAGDEKIGKGMMTIVAAIPTERVELRLEFFEPWESVGKATFELREGEAGAVDVLWRTEGSKNFSAKAASLFLDIEGAIGGDLEEGLASLKPAVEEAAKKRAEEEEAARQAAAIAAADEAAAGEVEVSDEEGETLAAEDEP